MAYIRGNEVIFMPTEETNNPGGGGGATFTPHVLADGTLYWTNDKGLPNPPAVNIRGPKGDEGKGFSISKTYASVTEMNADYTNNEVPLYSFVLIDTGNVDDVDNAKLYVKLEDGFVFCVDLSGSQGIKGNPGADGVTFTPYMDGTVLRWTNDKGLPNPNPVDLQGPPGGDGSTPTISVSKSGKVTTITITDKNGTKTASIVDGDSYVLTSADKNDIANMTKDKVYPQVTTADNGKFLRVVNGVWAVATVPRAEGVGF